jgi:hypothetical protein
VNVRKATLTLWTLTATLVAAAVLVATFGVLAPVEVSEPTGTRTGPSIAATSQASPDARLGLEAFEQIAALKLRKPLDGVTATPATSPQMVDVNPAGVGNPAGAPFTLVGTIGQSLAMIQTAGGGIEVKAVGEQANGAKIVAIRPAQVDVEFGGARMTIAKPKPAGGG